MTLAVKDICFPQLSLIMLVPVLIMMILISLEDHNVAGLSLQINQCILYNIQEHLVAT